MPTTKTNALESNPRRTVVFDPIETRAIDTLRILAVDAVEKANSGHPGTAMALAPVAHVLEQGIKKQEKWQQFIGGAADLAPSTKTNLDNYPSFTFETRIDRNLRFGIREHAMGAIINGMALTEGIHPFGATFLIFSDYMRTPMEPKLILIATGSEVHLALDGQAKLIHIAIYTQTFNYSLWKQT